MNKQVLDVWTVRRILLNVWRVANEVWGGPESIKSRG